jgi:hypothetical protein
MRSKPLDILAIKFRHMCLDSLIQGCQQTFLSLLKLYLAWKLHNLFQLDITLNP